MTAIYLDHNATTPVRPEAAQAVARALGVAGNPSSVHAAGRAARRLLEDSREAVAALAGAGSEDVVFTSGGSEANWLALMGTGRERLLVSAIEHESVLKAREDKEIVPVDRDGLVNLERLDAMLSADSRPALVSVMLANNLTGVIQPVAEIARLAHAKGALVHCDAVQAAGKIGVDFRALGVDLMSLSAHKLGGPMGAGALIVSDKVDLQPRGLGGGQERGRRQGTEPLPAIAGFAAAAKAALAELPKASALSRLRDRIESAILEAFSGAVSFGQDAPRLPNTACLAVPGQKGATQVMRFDLEGFEISAGSACSSGKPGRPQALIEMGVSPDLAEEAFRVSLGWTTTENDVETFIAYVLAARRSGLAA
jgi:cysteine desulfurase